MDDMMAVLLYGSRLPEWSGFLLLLGVGEGGGWDVISDRASHKGCVTFLGNSTLTFRESMEWMNCINGYEMSFI